MSYAFRKKRQKTCGMHFNEKWLCKMEAVVLREVSVAGEQEMEAKYSSEEKAQGWLWM